MDRRLRFVGSTFGLCGRAYEPAISEVPRSFLADMPLHISYNPVMPAFTVNNSIHIDAPIDRVFESVRNFNEWTAWSPWLIAEPGATVEQLGPDAYSWEGKIVGSGKMDVIDDRRPNAIDYKLHFYKPWKSQADVRFEFAERDGGTETTWSMNSSLPFFMFWMTETMSKLIGMDYQRGLNMLKDHIETGSVPSTLELAGIQPFAGLDYIGVRKTCSMEEISEGMAECYGRLNDWMQENGEQPASDGLSIYHHWNLKTQTTDFTAAFPVPQIPSDLPSGLRSGSLPACDAFLVRHTGPYRHLGNAWSAGMQHKQAKQFKASKKIDCFEIYEHCAGDPDGHENVTAIYLPVKG